MEFQQFPMSDREGPGSGDHHRRSTRLPPHPAIRRLPAPAALRGCQPCSTLGVAAGPRSEGGQADWDGAASGAFLWCRLVAARQDSLARSRSMATSTSVLPSEAAAARRLLVAACFTAGAIGAHVTQYFACPDLSAMLVPQIAHTLACLAFRLASVVIWL